MTTSPSQNTAMRNVTVLVLAQAILGNQVTMTFVAGALAGQQLAPNICLATLPLSVIVFGTMTTAPWLSAFMQNHGRKAGFFLGAAAGTLGAVIAAAAVLTSSFSLLLLGSYFTGVYMCGQGFYRFAATDTAPEAFRPKAISYVLAAGLVSVITGPQLVKLTDDIFPIIFLGTYLAIIALNLMGTMVFFWLDIPKPPKPQDGDAAGRSRKELLRAPEIAVAIICGMVVYALMNLVMTSTPLAVVGCGFTTGHAADIISAHVLAMFIPSFFTGHLIARFGVYRIMSLGLVILALAGATALQGVQLGNFYVALILLGLGWNFGFIGATTLLAQNHEPSERGRVQGMNDAIIFGVVTLATLASGGLLNCTGSDVVQGWTAVNLAMAPLLTLAGAALIWILLRDRRAA